MADAKMNAAWWKANKAKTLLDSGDTVLKALTAWDEVKKSLAIDKADAALDKIEKTATALKGKANSKLHKETIGYLATYVATAKEASEVLKKADGKSILKSMANLPTAVFEQLKGLDSTFWVGYGDSLAFLNAMKSGKGSKKIYDTYIAPGSASEVNLPGADAKAVTTAVEAGDFEGPAWSKAVSTIKAMIKANEGTALKGCAVVEKKAQLKDMQNK